MMIKTDKYNGCNTVEFKIRYNEGGTNYSNYKQEHRGFYVHVTPLKLTEENGFIIREHAMFSGFKLLVEIANRNSQKKIQTHSLKLDQNILNDAVQSGDFNQIAIKLAEIYNLKLEAV